MSFSDIWQCVLSYSWLHTSFILPQDFAPVFIMLRVILGRARPETEWSSQISGLEFNCNPGGGAGAQADRSRSSAGLGTNSILAATRSHLVHEVDIEAGDGFSSDDSTMPGKDNQDGALSGKKEG
jgi:hypothetical protein